MQYNEKNVENIRTFVVNRGLREAMSNLYNIERKYDFVGYKYGETKEDNLTNVLRMFNRYGVFETQFNKDLCEFSYNDYKEMLSSFNIGYSSFNANKSFIKIYLKWCRYYDLCDNAQITTFDQITKEIVSYENQIMRHYIKNFDELQSYIDICIKNMLNVKSEFEILSHRAKIALYLAWIGIDKDDAVNITLGDFDENNKRIFIKSKNKYVDFKLYNKTLGDELIHYKNLSESINSETLVNELYLFYNFTDTKDPSSYLRNIVSILFGDNNKVVNQGNKRLSYTRVYLSGIYSRATKYAEEIDLKNPELMGELFQEDYSGKGGYSAMYRRYRDFLSYCEIMYPEAYKVIKFE